MAGSGGRRMSAASLRELPPGLPGLPLLGSALRVGRDILEFLTEAQRRGGDMASFHVGRARWLLVSRAETIEQVLLDRERAFDKPDAIYGPGRLLFGNTLTGLKGDVWRARRSEIAPAYHRQKLDAESIVAATRRWAGERAGRGTLRLDHDLKGLMIEVASSNLLGPDGDGAAELSGPIAAALSGMGARIRLGVPIPDWLPAPPVRKMRRGVADVHAFFEAAVARRRASGERHHDLLGTLVAGEQRERKLSDATVRDELAVMATVGGHQLSLAGCWTLLLLARHPEAAARVRAELADVLAGRDPRLDDLPRLTTLSAAIAESMRLYPPFYLIGREALRDTSIGGYRVPRGTTVILSPWVTHRLEAYFEAPGEFRPQRWEDGLARRLPRGAYFPLGGGGRLCVGHGTVHKQLALVLAALLSCHRVDIDPALDIRPHATTSIEPRGGIPGRLAPRARDGSP